MIKIKCGRCGKEFEAIGMTYNEHYRIFARFRKDDKNYEYSKGDI